MKGGRPPAAGFAVFTSHPATPPRRAAPAPLSRTAWLLNPREQQGRGDASTQAVLGFPIASGPGRRPSSHPGTSRGREHTEVL